jgi:hypothetical protein
VISAADNISSIFVNAGLADEPGKVSGVGLKFGSRSGEG